MKRVAAPKKQLSPVMLERLSNAASAAQKADSELWLVCAEALREGSYDQVAAVVGVARSTLQEKIRKQSG